MRKCSLVVGWMMLGALACGGSDEPAEGGAAASGGGSGVSAGPTFHGEVEAVLQKRCQTCHREGGIAPFELTRYETAKEYAGLIRSTTKERTMPPWGADETADCKPRLPFIGDMRMTQEEIDLIGKWVDGGTPQGDPAKAPAAVKFSDALLPGATHDLPLPVEYTLPASNSDKFECFVIDPKIAKTTFINGVAVVPGNPLVVHHVLVFKDTKREALKLADADGKYECFGGSGVGSASLFAAWAPGVPASDFGSEIALELEQDSLFVVQLHYHPLATQDAKDRTRIQLREAPAEPKYVARTRLLGNSNSPSGALRLLPGPNDTDGKVEFRIPANVSGHTETMEFTVPSTYKNTRVAAAGAHMHWVGKNLKIELQRAAGTSEPEKECLLETPRYDFNWQRGYAYDAKSFDELPPIGPGDTLRITCTYDNTMGNRGVAKALAEKHMTSPVEVLLGEETLEEMCLGTFTLVEPLHQQGGGGGGGGSGGPLPCDVGALPADLPTISGKFAVNDPAKGSTVPTTEGGDPKGLWIIDKLTTYIEPAFAGFLDLETSKTEGIAFFEFGDGQFRQASDFVTTLVTGPAGTIEQKNALSSEGSYAVNGNAVDLSPTCPEGGNSTSLGFTVTGDKITIISKQKTQNGGTIHLVFEGSRRM